MNNGKFTIIYPGVIWAGEYSLDEFVIIGYPFNGMIPGETETHIGVNALIRSHTIIYTSNRIGDNFQTGHNVLVRERNEIGNDVSIGSGSVVEHHVQIGNRVRLHSKVFVPEYTILEDDSWLGPDVVITNAKYPRSPQVKEQLKGVYVEQGAIIGANATLLPGIHIGKNALIGAGSVVTIDIPPGAVVAGNPARIINTISNLPYGGSSI